MRIEAVYQKRISSFKNRFLVIVAQLEKYSNLSRLRNLSKLVQIRFWARGRKLFFCYGLRKCAGIIKKIVDFNGVTV